MSLLVALPAAAAPLAFEVAVVKEWTHPQLAGQKWEGRIGCVLEPDRGRWVMTNIGARVIRGAKVVYDGTEVLETESLHLLQRDGESNLVTLATVHCQYEGIPITLDQPHLTVWMAFLAGPALRRNQGKPFPSLYGEYCYDLHSHCCVLECEWHQPNGLVPDRGVYRYSTQALAATEQFLSEEIVADHPQQWAKEREAYRAYVREKAEGQTAGHFQVQEWVQASGWALPKRWVHELSAWGLPAHRVTVQLMAGPSEVPVAEFEQMLAYDATRFDRLRDWRFLPMQGLARLDYKLPMSGPKAIPATNDAFFGPRIAEKVKSVRRVHSRSPFVSLRPSWPVRMAFFLAWFVLPLALWRIAREVRRRREQR